MTTYEPQITTVDMSPTEPKPRAPWWLRVTILPIACMLVAIYSSAVLYLPPLGRLSEDDGTTGMAMNVVGCAITTLVAVALAWLVMRVIDRRPLRETGLVWTRSSLTMFGAGLGVSILVVFGLGWVLRLTGVTQPVDGGWTKVAASVVVMAVIAKLAQAFLLQGFPEELFFRGYVLQTLRHRPVLALAVSSIVFGLIHLVSQGSQQNGLDTILYLVWPAGFGFCAAALALRTRSLWAAVGIHGGSHTANLLLSLTGTSAEGRMGWVVVGLGYAVAGAVILRGWRRTWQPAGTPTVLDR